MLLIRVSNNNNITVLQLMNITWNCRKWYHLKVQDSVFSQQQSFLQLVSYTTYKLNVFYVTEKLYDSKIIVQMLIYFHKKFYNLYIFHYIIDRTMQNQQSTTYCNKGDQHENKQIIMICLNEQCIGNCLCCVNCIDELHRKHQLISLKKMEHRIINTVFGNTMNPQKQKILILLNDFENNIKKKIAQVKHNFCLEMDQIQQNVKKQLHKVYQTFSFTPWDQKQRQKFYHNITNQSIKYHLETIKTMQVQHFRTAVETQKGLLEVQKYVENNFKQAATKIDKIVQGLNSSLNKLKFGAEGGLSSLSHKFSLTNKAVCLLYNSQRTIVHRGQGAGGYPIAVLQQPLSPMNNSVSFMVVQQPGNFGIWMGICILDIVKTFNFQNCYGLSKGTYAIDQVGMNHLSAYSWNHHNMDYNSKPKVGWTFTVNQKVTISVNFDNSMVIFQKGQNSFQMPIKLDQGPIYAFAGPTNLNDKIKIIF